MRVKSRHSPGTIPGETDKTPRIAGFVSFGAPRCAANDFGERTVRMPCYDSERTRRRRAGSKNRPPLTGLGAIEFMVRALGQARARDRGASRERPLPASPEE